ncbi:hypothetical protein D3C87_1674510 [compost metagenome]
MIGADGGLVEEEGQQEAVGRGQHQREAERGRDGIAIDGVGLEPLGIDHALPRLAQLAGQEEGHRHQRRDQQARQR